MIHKFVRFIPDNLEDNIIYISIEYSIAIHNCCCGCGNRVVTPFSPTDWKLIFDGESVSLYPSIGNWSFRCKSHYWITNNKIIRAESWSNDQIKLSRFMDQINKKKYYAKKLEDKFNTIKSNSKQSLFTKIKRKLFSLLKLNKHI